MNSAVDDAILQAEVYDQAQRTNERDGFLELAMCQQALAMMWFEIAETMTDETA